MTRQSRDPYIAAAYLVDRMGEVLDRIVSETETIATNTTRLATHLADEEAGDHGIHSRDVEIAADLAGLTAKNLQILAEIVGSLAQLVATHFEDHSG